MNKTVHSSQFTVHPSPIPLPQGEGVRGRAGLTLIEVLVALTILAVGLLGVALMQVTSISGGVFSREMSTATQLGQDMLEKLRTLEYTSSTTNYALQDVGNHPDAADVSNGVVSSANPVDERGQIDGPRVYTRTWAVTDNSPAANMKTITVTISWSEKGTTHSIIMTGVKVRE